MSVLVPCLLLWAQLYTLGLLSEGRSYAPTLEYVRLAVIVPSGFLMLQTSSAGMQLSQASWVFLIIYILASALWLRKSS